jgi:hypothetical protein
LIRRKILDSTVDEVSEALSMHVAPLAIQIVVVPTGVTVLLGLCNPPHSWTDTVGPSLLGLTITSCVDSLLWYRLIRQPKSILVVSLNPPTGVDRQHKSWEAQSLYPSALQLTCTLRLEFVGHAT